MITLNTATLPDKTITQVRSFKSFTYAIAFYDDDVCGWAIKSWHETFEDAETSFKKWKRVFNTPVEMQNWFKENFELIKVSWYKKILIETEVSSP